MKTRLENKEQIQAWRLVGVHFTFCDTFKESVK